MRIKILKELSLPTLEQEINKTIDNLNDGEMMINCIVNSEVDRLTQSYFATLTIMGEDELI